MPKQDHKGANLTKISLKQHKEIKNMRIIYYKAMFFVSWRSGEYTLLNFE